jgi:hypothetical protein
LANCSSPFAGFNCYVEVIVSQPQTALLSAVFMDTGPTIAARAVALANTTATADGCVVALGEAAHAIDISTIGSPALTLTDCAIYDNSPDNPGALTLDGSATINAKAAYIARSVSGSGLTTTDGTFTGVNPITDPYVDRSFTWPSPRPNASGTNCNKTVNLCPGVYIVDQGTWDLNSVNTPPATNISTLCPGNTQRTAHTNISTLCPGNTIGGATIVVAMM